MSKLKQNMFFIIEGTNVNNLLIENTIGTCELKNGKIKSRYFGGSIRAGGLHSEAETLLLAALKCRKYPTKKTIIEINREHWNDFLKTKDYSIIKKQSKQILPTCLDSYDLEPGKIKRKYIIHEIKYFLDYNFTKTYISEDLAFMLEMVDQDKVYKIKTSEISIPEYLNMRRKGCGDVHSEVIYSNINSDKKETLSFLDFYKLIK